MHCGRFHRARRRPAARCSPAAPTASARSPCRRCWASRPSAADSSTSTRTDPLAPRPPHFPAKAKSVIFLFMDGGPSQVDTFDPKPRLDREHGQPIKVKTQPTQFNNVGNVLKSPWKFRNYGAERHPGQRPVPARRRVRRRPGDRPLDGLELLRAHERQLLPAHRHRASRAGRAMGAWVTYGLGSECQRPARLRRPQRRPDPARRARLLQQRLPAGVVPGLGLPGRRSRRSPTSGRPSRPTAPAAQARLCCARSTGASSAGSGTDDSLESAIANYELAFRMQTAVPDLIDLGGRVDGDAGALRPGRSVRARRGSSAAQCLRRPPAGRARRPVHRAALPERRRRPLGPARQPRRAATRTTPAPSTSRSPAC